MSVVLASAWLTLPAGMRPGQRAIAGMRMPPSPLLPLKPLSGALLRLAASWLLGAPLSVHGGVHGEGGITVQGREWEGTRACASGWCEMNIARGPSELIHTPLGLTASEEDERLLVDAAGLQRRHHLANSCIHLLHRRANTCAVRRRIGIAYRGAGR